MAAPAVHWVGLFLIFVAFILLLVTTISAPVIKDIAILKVMLTNHTDIRNSSVTFGSFGHCILDVPPLQTDQDLCFPKSIGYKPAVIMEQIDGPRFSTSGASAADRLTNAMVLHPIACFLAFVAFCLAFIPGVLGALVAASVTALTWIITLVVMAIDFALFGVIKNHVNSDGSGSHAYYSTGMWTCLAAMILLFLATFMVFFSGFSRRRNRTRAVKDDKDRGNGYFNDSGVAGEEISRGHYRMKESRSSRDVQDTVYYPPQTVTYDAQPRTQVPIGQARTVYV